MQLIRSNRDIPTRALLTHMVSCIAFLILPFISSRRETDTGIFSFGPLEIEGFISSLLLIFFFYANYFYFLPRFVYQKKYFRWALVMIGCFLFILFVSHFIVSQIDFYFLRREPAFTPPFLHPPHNMQNESSFEHYLHSFRFQESLLKFLFVLLLSFLLKTNKLWKETREEKRKAELAFLKSQVNPHFLFNTLNGIYSLSLQKSEETPQAIIKLSELMRYVVSEIDKESVTLGNEISYLQNYIDLQRLRLGDTVKVMFDTSEANPDVKISPLLFIFFVENSFKYGINTSKVSEIDIQIKSSENDLYFSVKNQKGNKNADITTQKGLENVTRRLELIYPQQHTLKTNNTAEEYRIELIIKNLK